MYQNQANQSDTADLSDQPRLRVGDGADLSLLRFQDGDGRIVLRQDADGRWTIPDDSPLRDRYDISEKTEE